MNYAQRHKIEELVLDKLFEELFAEGWHVFGVRYDNEGVLCDTPARAKEAVFSVEVSSIRFVKDINGVRTGRSVVIVLGNDGYDCIADHSCGSPADNFDVIMERVGEYAESLNPFGEAS